MSQAGFIKIATGTQDVETLTGNAGGPVGIDASNNINVVGAGGVTVTGDPVTNTLTITDVGGTFTWNPVTSALNPVTLVAENGYIANGAGVVQFMLPAAAAVGDMFRIVGIGNLWTLGQNALQSVSLGIRTTTVGVLGSITASSVKDKVEILCTATNTNFEILSAVGNLTFI
jgi:hypothetical protein